MAQLKNKMILMFTAVIMAVVAINIVEEDEVKIVEQSDALTIAGLPDPSIDLVKDKILSLLKGGKNGAEERLSYIPEKSYIVAVLQDDAVFDSKLVMGNRVVYDSGDDIKMVTLKASKVYVSGAKNGILDNCTITAFAELGLLTADIRSKRMQCMSLEGEMVDISVRLMAVGDALTQSVKLTDCQKVNVQQDNGDIVPQCVTGSVASGTPITFVVQDDIKAGVPIGVYTDETDQQLKHISSVFYESKLHNYTVRFTVELLEFGKVSFMRKLRTVDNIPVTMSVYGSNGYRQSVKENIISTSEDEFDFVNTQKEVFSSGALYRDGFRVTITPVDSTEDTINIKLNLDHQTLDVIDVFKHKKLKKLYELPSINTGNLDIEKEVQWGRSLTVPIQGVGTFVITPHKMPAITKVD